jgi:hypothetical protein
MKAPMLTKRIGLWVVGSLIGFLALAAVVPSSADADGPKVCAEAYEKSQEERKAGHITASIKHLTKCAAQECPSFISKDCIQWLIEAQNAQPSVVFAVRRDGEELSAVEITMDGRLLTENIDGKAIPLDPGAHAFVFRTADGGASEKSFIIREGERNRLIEIELPSKLQVTTPVPPVEAAVHNGQSPLADASAAKPARSWLPYGLVGVGVLGVSGFTVFGLWGRSQKNDLEDSCAPFCPSSKVDEVRTKYIVADACLAVGLVSLGVATYYFLRDREEPAVTSGTASTAAILPHVSHRGGAVDVAFRF